MTSSQDNPAIRTSNTQHHRTCRTSSECRPWESECPVRRVVEGIRPSYVCILLALVAFVVMSGWTRMALTQSATVTLISVGDATLKQGSPNTNQGGESVLRIQQSGSNRALVRFDQQALQQTVGNSSIRSAKLRLFIVANANNWGSDGREVNLHRLTQSWTEMGATWNCPQDTNTGNGNPDCNPSWEMGGSSLPPFAIAPTHVVLHQNNQTGWVEWEVTGDVRQFLAGQANNYGWIVRKDDEGASGQVDYASRESSNQPQLLVELGEPVPPVSSGLTAISDADVRSGSPNQNQGNRMRLQVQSSGNNRVLVQFDRQAMLATVGSGTLQTAKLRLYVVANANNWGSSGRAVNVHRMTQAWTEHGTTWNCPNDLNPYNSQSDCSPNWSMSNSGQWPFVSAATGSMVQQNNQTGWVEWDVTPDVAQILSNSVPNHGWLVRKDNEGQAGQVEYGSRESQFKPELLLTVEGTNNQAPQISAGADHTITFPSTASLAATATDDGLPSGSTLTYLWSQLSGPGTASFDNPGSAAAVATFTLPGTYVLRLTVSDSQLSTTDELTVVVNPPPPVNQAPQVSAGPDQTITLPATASLSGSASDDGLPTGSTLLLVWSKVGGPGTVVFTATGAAITTASFSTAGVYELRLTASDSELSTSDDVSITVNPAVPVLPPDPVSVAPPLDRTVVTTVFKASEFLYSGPNPIQTGVAPGTITPIRAAVLRGKVITQDGQPLSGVSINIVNHPELGQTLSREDGRFDLVVNGGGILTVNYEKAGLLPAQRQVNVPWQDYRAVPTVALITLDPQVSMIAAASAAIQVHQGSVVTDSDGSRRATLLFPPGTTATMELPGGVTQALNTLHVRATEYTVGPNGPAAMPATLPANSFYTYCVEFSVDEAIAVNARTVRFNQPVVKYVDNFLGVSPGTIVPEGYYDRQQAQWVAADSGRVIQVLAVVDSQAILDVDGTGTPAMAEALAALGITGTERLKLAELFAPGESFWRVPIDHFSTWDSNWGSGPGAGDTAANQTLTQSDNQTDCHDQKTGSVIECQNQVLGENLALTGVPFGLHYNSDRVPGRNVALQIPLSGSSIPERLKRIRLEVEVAGQRFEQEYPAAPNQKVTFAWDGRDGYGRRIQGRQPVRVSIGYVYDAVYGVTSRFGYNGNGIRITGVAGGGGGPSGLVQARIELTLWQELQAELGVWEPEAAGLGSWTLSIHHGYDPVGKTVYHGTGERRRAEDLNAKTITTVAGNRSLGLGGDGGPATQSPMDPPFGLAFSPEGSLYIADVNYSRIRRVNRQGIISTSAGIASSGFSGDGGPANLARLNSPRDVAVGADGSLYIADTNNHRIRRVTPDGIISTFAGTGVAGFSGDGGLATLAQLNFPHGLAMGPDGSLYVADKQNHRIRRIEPGGTITTVAGNGVAGYDGHGVPATQTRLKGPEAIAVRPDGALYIADTENHFVRLVTSSGIIWPVAGTGPGGPLSDGEGVPASATAVSYPNALAVDATGGYFVTSVHRVRYIDPIGRIYTAAGKTDGGNSSDGNPANETLLNGPSGLAVGPDGNLYISDTYSYRVCKVVRPLPGQTFTDLLIPSQSGSELYVFDSGGKHLQTLNALTGSVLYQFGYNSQGLLTTVTDADGDVTTVERDGAGKPTAIVGPFGQRTTLTVDGSGYLTSLTSPNNETVQLTPSPTGLLLALRDPKNQEYRLQYDGEGRLTRDEDPAGGFQTLARTELVVPLPPGATSSYEVTHQTALGQQTRYQVNQLTSGAEQMKNFLPDGTVTISTIGTNGGSTRVDAAGNQTTLQLSGDPRWGLQAPFAKSVLVTTPGGLSSTVLSSRIVALSDPANPLSLTTQTDTSTVNGRTYTSTYDAGTRRFTSTTPLGRQTTSTLDNIGRIVQTQLASFNPVSFAYDARGRIQSISQGSGAETRTSTFGYNSLGYLETVTDPLNRVTSFQYDDAGRITQQTLPGNHVIGFTYDANGNLTSLTPPGKPQHAFDYTEVDLMKEYDPPTATNVGTRVTTYSYDSERQPTLVTRPDGQTIDFDYDSAGRLTTINLPSRELTYSYNATTGNLSSITDSSGSSLTYTYDGSLPQSSTWTGPVAGSVAWNYDNNFRPTSRSINGANTINFGYDNDSLLTQSGALTLSRNPQNGLLTGTTLGTVTDSWTYNNFAEPTVYTAAVAGTPVFSTAFTRDKLGRITAKTDTIQGVSDTYVYGYDTAGRLETVTKNGTLISQYTYDTNGNRLTALRSTNPEPLTTHTYDAQDRLLSTQDSVLITQCSYNANGELQSKTNGSQTTSYEYDVVGNLRHVTLPDGTQIDYVIDAQNRRVGKKVNGVLVQGWLYGNQLNPIAELDGSNQIVTTFIYGSRSNIPDYLVKAGVTYRIISDHLGSPRLVINAADGSITQRLDYDEFGNLTHDSNLGFQPFGLAGGLYDNQTKLTRFGARDYDAEFGRWTAKDPIGFEGGDSNIYRYVVNDPTNEVDNSGLILYQDTRPKLPDWVPDWLKSFLEPDAFDLSPTPLGMAAGKVCKLVARPARKLAPIIIGEGMKTRIIPYAEKVGGHYWKPRGFKDLAAKNERWLEDMIRQGREVIDLGIDTSRTVRSRFYQLERQTLDRLGYPTTKP